MNRFSKLKLWWRTTPIDIKCVETYVYSSTMTFFGLFTGNMYHSVIMAYKTSNHTSDFVFDLLWYSMPSCLKSVTYAAISPIFIPYAITKWLYFEPQYIRRQNPLAPYETINGNGPLPHLIPLCFGGWGSLANYE